MFFWNKLNPDITSDLYSILDEYKYDGHLVHYTSTEVVRSICHSDTFWLKRTDKLEDLTEGYEIISILKKVSRFLYRTGNLSERLYNAIANYEDKYVSNPEEEAMYTACFTTESDSYLMWKAYASNATGCSIEINTQNLDNSLKFIHVIYGTKTKNQIMDKLIRKLDQSDIKPNEYKRYLDFILSTLRFLFKSTNFKTEKEIRIIQDPIKALEEKVDVFPHIEVCFKNSQPYLVTLGPRNNITAEDLHYLEEDGAIVGRSKIKLAPVIDQGE